MCCVPIFIEPCLPHPVGLQYWLWAQSPPQIDCQHCLWCLPTLLYQWVKHTVWNLQVPNFVSVHACLSVRAALMLPVHAWFCCFTILIFFFITFLLTKLHINLPLYLQTTTAATSAMPNNQAHVTEMLLSFYWFILAQVQNVSCKSLQICTCKFFNVCKSQGCDRPFGSFAKLRICLLETFWVKHCRNNGSRWCLLEKHKGIAQSVHKRGSGAQNCSFVLCWAETIRRCILSCLRGFMWNRNWNPWLMIISAVQCVPKTEIKHTCANKWSWSWLDKKHDDVAFAGWCHKLEEAGQIVPF